MRMRNPLVFSLLGLGLGLTAAAFADDSAKVGHKAITDMLQRRLGRGVKAVFQSTGGRFSGTNERLITGRGYTKQGRNSRDFTYEVLARTDGSSARDLRVRFQDGATLNESGPYYDRGGNAGGRDEGERGRPTFRKPERDFTDNDGDVTFSGDSRGQRVDLVVSMRNGREVARRRLDVKNDRWETNLKLDPGAYTARVTNPNGRGEDTVNFRVDRGAAQSDLRATFTKPARGFRDKDGDVTFEGDAEGREVELRIFRGTREVAVRRLTVTRDRWSTNLRLGRGDYRATVRDVDGRRTEEVRFSVDS